MIAPAATLLAGAVRAFTGARVSWIGCRPEPRQRVYFGNHTSHVDGPLVWSALPREIRRLTRCVAAADYWGEAGPARRLIARFAGAVLVARDGLDTAGRERQIAVMLEAMGERGSLIIFPEGTRGDGPDIAPFRSGLYHLSRGRPGLQLVPVHLDNVHRILPKGEVLPVPMTCSVTFGPPITLGDGEPKHAFLERAREAIRALAPREHLPC
jgi:1-acyl-sn-glycerol-3-phosphate acyltransferase